MDRFTFGDSQSAQNLISDILQKPEYKPYSRKVAHLLSMQLRALVFVAKIPDKSTRIITLKMWRDRFTKETEDLPKLIKTHIRCISVTKCRQILEGTK